MEHVGVRRNTILSELRQAKKTSLYEWGTECCVLQAADTAGAEPVVDHCASACHEDVLGEQTFGSSHS